MTFRPLLYLIDGSSNLYRSYHAIKNLSNSKGFPTNAIYGFTSMLVKLFQDHKPQYLGIVFDAKGPTFRHKVYQEYKATRPGIPDDLVLQIPFVKRIVRGFNIKALELEGYEADDVIGTISKKAAAQGIATIIVSGDKDFYQLIEENITLLDTKNNTIIGLKEVQKRYGVEPEKIVEVLGLAGDSSDNVPGVAGVGIKTAIKLIQKYQSINNLYNHLEEIPQENLRNKLSQGYKNACLSKELVTINTQLPISFELKDFQVKAPDPKILEPIFKELEFTRFLKEFIPRKTPSPKEFILVESEKEFQNLLQRLKASKAFALWIETTNENPLQAEVIGFSFSFQGQQAFYIPVDHLTSNSKKQLPKDFVFAELKPLLEDGEIKKFGHNIKNNYIVLYQKGIHLSGVAGDIMIASYLLNPSTVSYTHLTLPTN